MTRKTCFLVCLFLGVTILGACQGPRPEEDGPEPLVEVPETSDFPQTGTDPASSASAGQEVEVRYCRERTVEPPPARVQLLLDASGSMNGLTASLQTLVTWVAHAVSGLRGSTLELTAAETCLFNQNNGIAPCLPGIALPPYVPVSNTNLHQAIRRAADADLTLILTDGVAATGIGGDEDCAAGVDANCVARALREAIKPGAQGADEPSVVSGASGDPGIWILPLVTSFEGRFFTEELISAQSFDYKEALTGIRDELNENIRRETVIREPETGRDGRLVYHYQGPKALLLIIVARQQKLGRDAVWSLWEQSSLRNITQLEALREFDGGIGALRPFEVYPGYWNPIRFKTLEPFDDPSVHRGTLDVAFDPGPPRGSIRLDCPPDGSGEGVYILSGQRQERLESSSCVPLRQLPAYGARLEADLDQSDQEDLDAIVRDYRQEGKEEALRLTLTCGPGARRPCGGRPVQARWNVLRNYGQTASELAGEPRETEGRAVQGVKEISTVQPSRNPHRVFGLAPTLRAFYELVEPEARRLPLAELEVCAGSEQ